MRLCVGEVRTRSSLKGPIVLNSTPRATALDKCGELPRVLLR